MHNLERPRGSTPETPERTREKSTPISWDDYRFIEQRTGEYQGYVETRTGPVYVDTATVHHAYYDSRDKKIYELMIEIAGSDGMGDAVYQLPGPKDVTGFDMMIVRLFSDGKEAEDPLHIDLYDDNFPKQTLSLEKLRQIARKLADLAVSDCKAMPFPELRKRMQQWLVAQGYRGEF